MMHLQQSYANNFRGFYRALRTKIFNEIEISTTLKHLHGLHDEKKHGRWAGHFSAIASRGGAKASLAYDNWKRRIANIRTSTGNPKWGKKLEASLEKHLGVKARANAGLDALAKAIGIKPKTAAAPTAPTATAGTASTKAPRTNAQIMTSAQKVAAGTSKTSTAVRLAARRVVAAKTAAERETARKDFETLYQQSISKTGPKVGRGRATAATTEASAAAGIVTGAQRKAAEEAQIRTQMGATPPKKQSYLETGAGKLFLWGNEKFGGSNRVPFIAVANVLNREGTPSSPGKPATGLHKQVERIKAESVGTGREKRNETLTVEGLRNRIMEATYHSGGMGTRKPGRLKVAYGGGEFTKKGGKDARASQADTVKVAKTILKEPNTSAAIKMADSLTPKGAAAILKGTYQGRLVGAALTKALSTGKIEGSKEGITKFVNNATKRIKVNGEFVRAEAIAQHFIKTATTRVATNTGGKVSANLLEGSIAKLRVPEVKVAFQKAPIKARNKKAPLEDPVAGAEP